jgi:hypothetical protein
MELLRQGPSPKIIQILPNIYISSELKNIEKYRSFFTSIKEISDDILPYIDIWKYKRNSISILLYGKDKDKVATWLTCLLIHYNSSVSVQNAISTACLYTDGTVNKITVRLYKKPLKVLCCGDRYSSSHFEEVIRFELKQLPPKSVVVHGGCKGIDILCGMIAIEMGLEVRPYPISKIEWNTYGLGAGPLRNKKMLEEHPDYVIGFHPDISYSKGTVNMLTQAYRAGYRTYIHDLKYRVNFEIPS